MKKYIKKKIRWKNVIIAFLFIIFVTTGIISAINIYHWKIDSNKVKSQLKNIDEINPVKENNDNENTEIIEQDTEIPKSNPYWDYIKMNLINVDFEELKIINTDTKGWITVNGTNINYPFVQTANNDYYLKHAFDKSYNSAGWVFMDYRNSLDPINKNIILYAHGRYDTTMFGSLKNILTSGWLDNTNNYVIRLSTESENTLWQVFSVYHIPTTSDYLKINFLNNEEFLSFTQMLIDRSAHNFNTTVGANDKIITLSTCYNDREKVVLHAKLIKKESRKSNN